MIIDCGSCAVAGLACDDCVVTVLLGPVEVTLSDMPQMPDSPGYDEGADVVPLPLTSVADEHAPAIAVLAEAGLIPPLRLVRRSAAS